MLMLIAYCLLLYAYLGDSPEILTDAQYLQSSASSVTPCSIAEQSESPIKLKLRRLTKQTSYKVIVDDSKNEENLSRDDSDNYIPSVSETSSESESTDQLTDLQRIDPR